VSSTVDAAGEDSPLKQVLPRPKNDHTLAVGTSDGEVYLWDLTTSAQSVDTAEHANYVGCLAFSPDSKTLACTLEDNSVRLWNGATGETEATLRGHEALVWSVAFSPDGQTLASGSKDRTVHIWDVPRTQE
jgi:WD40 repeat protein